MIAIVTYCRGVGMLTDRAEHTPLSACAALQPYPELQDCTEARVMPPDVPVAPGPVDAAHRLPLGVHCSPAARLRHPHPGSAGRYWVFIGRQGLH